MAVEDNKNVDVEFIPRSIGDKSCDGELVLVPTVDWRYPLYPWTGDNNYPEDACGLLRHDYVQVTDLKSDNVYSLNAKSAVWDAKKSFDIPHPTKENHRLRYITLEGPNAEVYYRGKLKNENIINLPEYWTGLVDPETIGVNLTPVGSWQELYVEKIQWGTQIIIKNNSGSQINCDYVVYGERKDTPKNISEYPGLTPDDYPGDNREYNINSI
jgi:hypothetical protein